MRYRMFAGAALCVLALCILFASHPALAQDMAIGLKEVGANTLLPKTNLAIIVARIIRVVIGTVGIIFTVIVVYAGFLIMTSQGDVDTMKKAKKMITNGIIGMAICLFSFTITQFILSRLLAAVGAGGSVSSIASQYSEPLSGSLGAGIIDSHYPERNAIDVPRNTFIMVSFKQAINPSSIISGYDEACESETSACSTDLNAANVRIYRTDQGETAALGARDVLVSTDSDHMGFLFDPVGLLGDGVEDRNYTVVLTNDIQLDNAGGDAFGGPYSGGYEWTFEVSTEVDLIPPKVVSVIPRSASPDEARNVTVSITFDEAMHLLASKGTYASSGSGNFRNIEVLDENGQNVDGTFEISNGYKTVDFTPALECGTDPCGDAIYCLPADQTVSAEAHAASLGSDPPQAQPVGVTFDGLVDASGNSLDGNGDDDAQGSATDAVSGTDDYAWSFGTTDEIFDDPPEITGMTPGIEDTFADQDADVQVEFNMPMKSSTLNSSNVSLWPDPWYEFWFTVSKTDVDTGSDGDTDYTTAQIKHPLLVSSDDEGWLYRPVVTRGVKSNWQICMFPAFGPDASGMGTCDVTNDRPYCCDGEPSASACPTSESTINLPDTSE